MELPTASEFFSAMLQPSLKIILFSFAVALLLPILVHYTFYRKATGTAIPSFLLVGASGAGKTALLTCLEAGKPSPTRTSQTPSTSTLSLPAKHTASSSQFRSTNDPSHATRPTLQVTDTPGHGKLRQLALEAVQAQGLAGVVFVVDAADLPPNSPQLRDAASFLHDVLLTLQKRASKKAVAVLVAANKLDLFTALPAAMVQRALEQEISEVRESRAKGLMDSGIGMDGPGGGGGGGEDEGAWLGEGGEGGFRFEQLLDAGVEVSVRAGAVEGEVPKVEAWWQWIAEQM